MFPQNNTYSACIMESNCTLSKSACKPKQFIYHHTGVLFSGQGTLNFIKKNPDHHENKIIERKFSTFGLAWVSWEEAVYVQHDGLKLSGPTQATNIVTVTYPVSLSSDWWDILNNASASLRDEYKTKGILDDLHDLKHVIASAEQHFSTSR